MEPVPTCEMVHLCLDWRAVDRFLTVFWAIFCVFMLVFLIAVAWSTRRR